jgi:hypothetical protein
MNIQESDIRADSKMIHLGQMTVQEQIAVEGASAQTVTNRYGDYSQMTMDPTDDLTFWFTG